MERQIQAVIFDMDGVLVDTEWMYLEQYAVFFQQHGYNIEAKDLTFHAGGGPWRNWEEVVRRFNIPWDRQTYHELSLAHVESQVYDYKSKMNDGVPQLLAWLRQQGLPLAVASSSGQEVIHNILGACGILSYFDSILAGEMVEETKPHPAVYLETARRLGVAPGRCLVVEDSPRGLQAALAAGTVTVAKDDARFGFDLSAAHHHITHMGEVRPLVERLG